MRFSRRISATVRSGWATYQPSAVIWCLTIQSFTSGLRMPGQPSNAENDDVQFVGNLRREVVDVGVPVAVEGRGEEHPRVVVEEHEAHVVEGADLLPSAEGCRPATAVTRAAAGRRRARTGRSWSAQRPSRDGRRSGRRFPSSMPAPPAPATSALGARSPAPLSPSRAHRHKAPATAGSFARRSDPGRCPSVQA